MTFVHFDLFRQTLISLLEEVDLRFKFVVPMLKGPSYFVAIFAFPSKNLQWHQKDVERMLDIDETTMICNAMTIWPRLKTQRQYRKPSSSTR